MKNLKYFSLGLFSILFILGIITMPNFISSYSNSIESVAPYDLLIHNLYPYLTYDELMECSDIIVSGQVVSISESKWSTPDGKQPDGVIITEKVDENGEPCIDFLIDLKENEFIYTDIIFKVNTIYMGDLKENEIVVRFLTGTVDNLRMSDESGLDIQNYKEGGNYLFFLSNHRTYGGEKIPNCYSINTPRGALINTNPENFINFDGEKFDPNVLYK
ncbi:MAG: hypothetical protein LBU81_04280 [Methanosarcinales archaeon]|jgi:hypothetical protein|nr:hypothetical protein [Methanosarcinales archaeon]